MPLNFRTEDEIYSALTVTKSTKITTKSCECGTTVLHVHNESTQLLCMQLQAVVFCCCDVTCACRYTELAWHLFIFPANQLKHFKYPGQQNVWKPVLYVRPTCLNAVVLSMHNFSGLKMSINCTIKISVKQNHSLWISRREKKERCLMFTSIKILTNTVK